MIRTLAIVASLLALVGVIALDSPSPGGSPAASTTYPSEPRTLPAVCPGAQTVPVGDVQSGDAELDSGSTDVAYMVYPAGGEVIDNGTAFEGVGASVERIGTGDLAGLAGLTCAPTSSDQWLVGGSTALGSSARLVLSNPADTSVRAEVTLHTPVGAVEGTTSVVIGPGSQRTLLLEAIEPEMPTMAVRITAGGLGVSAAMQDSRLDGFTPAGSDWVTASAVGEALAVQVPIESDGSDGATLALIAPDGAQVDLAMATDDGDVEWIGESSLTLEPGVLTEIPVPAAGPGTVVVDSDAPVAASSRVQIPRATEAGVGDQAFDFAWTGSQLRADARQRAAIVPEGEVTLQLHADADADGDGDSDGVGDNVTVEFETGGQPFSVDVPRGGTASEPLTLPRGTQLSSDSEAAWTLVVTDDPGFITTLEPVSVELSSEDTTVTVGSPQLEP